jgi:hypothetical protein
MKNNLYSLSACEKLISKYLEIGGETKIIQEGSLGLGTVICFADGKKTAIIQEVFLNSWSSGHKVTMYNKTPKKYLNIINQ